MIRVIVSGGQTGVDRAALDFAERIAILRTGWCPSGRQAEDGPIPVRYPMMETDADDHAVRTEWNVRDSDGTFIITDAAADTGTRRTIEACFEQEKPFYMAELQQPPMYDAVYHWLRKYRIHILNIAGPRESESPGIYEKALRYLEGLWEFLSLPENERFIPSEEPDECDD